MNALSRGDERDPQKVREMLLRARYKAKHGDPEGALRLIRLAASSPVVWDNDDQLTPESVLRELESIPGYLSSKKPPLSEAVGIGPDSLRRLPESANDTSGIGRMWHSPANELRTPGQAINQDAVTGDVKFRQESPLVSPSRTDEAISGKPLSSNPMQPQTGPHNVPATEVPTEATSRAHVPDTGRQREGSWQSASHEVAVAERAAEPGSRFLTRSNGSSLQAQPIAPQVLMGTVALKPADDQQSLLGSQTFVQVGFMGGLLLCPIAVALIAFLALGRMASGKGFTFRVQVVNDPGSGGVTASTVPA